MSRSIIRVTYTRDQDETVQRLFHLAEHMGLHPEMLDDGEGPEPSVCLVPKQRYHAEVEQVDGCPLCERMSGAAGG